MERPVLVVSFGAPKLPFVPKKRYRTVVPVQYGHRHTTRLQLLAPLRTLDPPRVLIRQQVERDLRSVLVFEPEHQHVELKPSDDPAYRVLLTPGFREELNGAFLGKLLDTFLELLALQWIEQLKSSEVIR